MKISADCASGKNSAVANKNNIFAKAAGFGVVCLLAATPGMAQNERAGTSKPMPVTVTSSDDADVAPVAAPVAVAKPSAAVPASAGPASGVPGSTIPASAGMVYGPYNPATDVRRPLVSPASADAKLAGDPDAGMVTHVPSLPGQIPDGTLMKAKLRETLSTETTKPGSSFSAEVSEAVMRDGRVVVPVGALLQGRVTWTQAGKRISGGAAIHLEISTVVMPDGTEYAVHARVIDTNSWENTKVDSEGTIRRKDSGKKTLAVMGLAAGGGAAAGAMIGGPPGALIGAGVGAGVSTVIWLKQDKQAELPKDLGLVFSLTAPMAVSPANAAVGVGGTGTPGGE
jgi:hypothetical protein